ncbi:MAG: hypothetical protein M1826_001775 [Phylliscum demangeonii]|nr:MAG: hypothetical protein M1826_001775 [Phylliscum demangeonii]
MGKTKKKDGEKHESTRSPAVFDFVNAAVKLPLAKLPAHLAQFPALWPFQRGDLWHWSDLLDHFDNIFESFNREYGLNLGPQTQPFTRRLLLKEEEQVPQEGSDGPISEEDVLDQLGFGPEGDRQLLEAILDFSRLLLENCGSRSLYASSAHLNDLLNTSSLTLLHQTLRVTVCLAQRYHASRQRTMVSGQHVNPVLLASHYNLSLERVHQLALPFTRSLPLPEHTSYAAATTPTGKGKEKAVSADRITSSAKVHGADLVALVRPQLTSEHAGPADGPTEPVVATEDRSGWEEWGDVVLSYYPTPPSATPAPAPTRGAPPPPSLTSLPDLSPFATLASGPSAASQSTPLRRTLTSDHTDPASTPTVLPSPPNRLWHEHHNGSMNILHVRADTVKTTPIWQIMAALPSELAPATRFELLCRVRVASALVTSLATRQQALGVRILALTNLAYIYPEHSFQQKVLHQDVDEPRRLQLANQLAELVNPSSGSPVDVPRWLQTLSLRALEGLAKYRMKAVDVCAALNVNVNHGLLFYLLKKAVAEMAKDDEGDAVNLDDEAWRQALFSLLAYLPSVTRAGGSSISPGLLPVVMETLTLRTDAAERVRSNVVDFLTAFIYNVRDPFQVLANVKGLDILSELVAYEVATGYARAVQGNGIPAEYRHPLVDHELPFFQQQTLRRLFRFVIQMMSQNGLTLDRLLRNLIDSPPLLGGLKLVLRQAKVFGASIWSCAVDIISQFIHNEPTSYAVIAEAGLGKAFLDAVSGTINANRDGDGTEPGSHPTGDMATGDEPTAESVSAPAIDPALLAEYQHNKLDVLLRRLEGRPQCNIPASAEALVSVPRAFGAICLNAAGMTLFKESDALESFFDIFLSPAHIVCMTTNHDLPRDLGSAMDELIRHHPSLKTDVLFGVMTMVISLGEFYKSRVLTKDDDARLSTPAPRAPDLVAGSHRSSGGSPTIGHPGVREPDPPRASETRLPPEPHDLHDVEMTEVGSRLHSDQPSAPPASTQPMLVEEMGRGFKSLRECFGDMISTTTKFLTALFTNSSVCSTFIEMGGAERLLDIPVLGSLPHSANLTTASQSMARLMRILVEQKPHLVLPSLLRRTQKVLDDLLPFAEYRGQHAFLGPLCGCPAPAPGEADVDAPGSATPHDANVGPIVMSLVVAHGLCKILSEVFLSKQAGNNRISHTIFSQANLVDMYVPLIRALGQLQRACIVDEILLLKAENESGRGKDGTSEPSEASNVIGILHAYQSRQASMIDDVHASAHVSRASPGASRTTAGRSHYRDVARTPGASQEVVTRYNAEIVHHLYHQLPFAIATFLQGLGKALVTKRLSDPYHRQNAIMVAEAIADLLIKQIDPHSIDGILDPSHKEAYWMMVLTSGARLIMEAPAERAAPQVLTMVLQAFRNRDGFDAVKLVLDRLVAQLEEASAQGKGNQPLPDASQVKPTTGFNVILNFYKLVVTAKNVVEASQSVALASRDRSRDKADHFSPDQLVVELRLSVLPAVQALWKPGFVERAGDTTVKKLIGVLHAILAGDQEGSAYKRSENLPARIRSPMKWWKEPVERRDKLLAAGYSDDLVKEALYRCNDSIGLAEDYCKFMQRRGGGQRSPIPESALAPPPSPPSDSPRMEPTDLATDPAAVMPAGEPVLEPPSGLSATQTVLQETSSMDVDDPGAAYGDSVMQIRMSEPSTAPEQAADDAEPLPMNIDNLLDVPPDLTAPLPTTQDGLDETTDNDPSSHTKLMPPVVTFDDLEDRRKEIRASLIEIALDVLNVHNDVTFDIADLIITSLSKSFIAPSARAEIGETLVKSMVSLQTEDDFRTVGKKIAAHAHLIALVLRDKNLQEACISELKANLPTLLGFIRVFPDQPLEDSSPWVSHILLIFERLLAEDEQPRQIRWVQPVPGSIPDAAPVATPEDPVMSESHRVGLFNSILEILPRIGKDASLALSVVRVLVILTRSRQIAVRLGERGNLQRLFAMIKQLAGMLAGNLQSAFMLVLRHIVEDDEMIRQIMRSAIQDFFDSRPTSRQHDTNTYVRGLSPFILRAPEVFVAVSNDMLKLVKYDANQRHQILAMKSTPASTAENENADTANALLKAATAPSSKASAGDEKPLPQANAGVSVEKPQTSSAESRATAMPTTEGVIHYLLCELLSYKEVDDKEVVANSKEEPEQRLTSDVDMSDPETALAAASNLLLPLQPAESALPPSGGTFIADEHPFFIYRCFILQCLGELLCSYTKAKLEFVNFSRKATLQTTPSKPRSAILNYFLADLIPLGTLKPPVEDVTYRKKLATSQWAMSTVVSLCTMTGEQYIGKDKAKVTFNDEPELLLVRKFALDHSAKAYRDAMTSSEALDVKYARLLSLADLWNRMLNGNGPAGGTDIGPDMVHASQKLLAKLMLEKGFISSLTASVAEIDLNYPYAKRVIKYILRPLKLLTETAIHLGEASDLSSTLGHSEEDEVSLATSASEMEEEREETPDLFRNSTLGMLEPGREEDSSSASSEDDDELYEEEYGDEMEYEEDVPPEDEEASSDEDGEAQDMEGLPGDVGDMEVRMPGEEEDDGTDLDHHDSDDDDDDVDDDDDLADEMDMEGEDAGADEDGNGEWESDEDDQADYNQDGHVAAEGEHAHLHRTLHHHHGHHPEDSLEHIVRALESDEAPEMLEHLGGNALNLDLDPDAYIEDEMHEDDMSEHDHDDQDAEEDEDLMFNPALEDVMIPNLPFGWNPEMDDPLLFRGPPHVPPSHMPGPWSIFTSGPQVPTFRSHRPAGGMHHRVNDDGINPLLQRQPEVTPVVRDGRQQVVDELVHAITMSRNGRATGQRGFLNSFTNNVLTTMDLRALPSAANLRRHAATAQGAVLHAAAMPGTSFHVHLAEGPLRELQREIQTLAGGVRRPTTITIVQQSDPAQATSFTPMPTSARWQEESRLLYGQEFFDKTYRIINALLSALVPPAMIEEKMMREKKAAEEARRVEEEKVKQAERERVARLKEEEDAEGERRRKAEEQAAEEQAAQGPATQEQAAEATEATSHADVDRNSPTSGAVELSGGDEAPADTEEVEGMEGVETAPLATDAASATAGPSEAPVPRVRTVIRGRELDITGMDIDPEYLDALPEELREEVLMHQIAERRSQAATTGEQPTNISREFLEALPDDIRDELLEQEAQDRRRREREETRRRAAATSGAAHPPGEDMDPASVLATLDPALRQAILMEQDEDVLAQLPQEIAAEARALGTEHRLRHHFIEPGRPTRARIPEGDHGQGTLSSKRPPRRTVGPMLDKAGIATLLRLMFIPQQGSARDTLNSILQNICENKQNRIETVGLLLSILQDASADTAAVERSFAHLSLRARQPASQKAQQAGKRANDQLPSGICDISPLAVVQQCLNTLVLLVQFNAHLQTFFLTEHDLSSTLKHGHGKKGKSKEKKSSKYALNALLGLLDRKLVMESPTVMEQLATLLYSVTHPLSILLRKEKDPETPAAATAPAPAPAPAPSGDDAAASIADVHVSGPPTEMVDHTLPATDDGHPSSTAVENEPPVPDPVPAAEVAAVTASAAEPKSAVGEQAEGSKARKDRALEPPFVPDVNLCLVVNILTARECSGRTFRDTLSTINSLSAIPGAKDVFGKELLRQAQQMGQAILGDLNDLAMQITNAQTDMDVHGLALAKFSPASSSQAKLLRVLTALDYLFDSQRESGKTSAAGSGSEASAQEEIKKGDLLASLAHDATFGPLWAKLSECLTEIHQREHMLNLATILLPLIEALMVVCKNTTLRTPPSQRLPTLEAAGTPTPGGPERSKLEELFFRFTEEHRKILNDLVRHNPKLMSGTFSLLVKNPKVLEFDNKRNYFNRRLHVRGTEGRHNQPPLQLSVRRDQVFLDSFKSLYFKSGEEMKYGKLNIRFHGEEGVDAGGVTREWFQVLSRQMFNADYALFTPVAADRTTFHPNRLSAVNPEHFMFFKFIGRVIGKALYEGRVLDCHFSRAVYKRILGKPVSVKDMETLDLDYYKSLVWMLESDITDIITETFSVETEAFGETQIVDLKENGRQIPVTESNKQEYVRLVVEYRLTGSVQEQLNHFLTGFHDIVPAELISIFNEQELELLISGLPDIDVDDWKNNTEYHNYSASSPQIQWFWRAVRSFDKEERAKLLQFVTGTSKVPLNGFKELEGMNGFSRFNIHRDYASNERLPSSHTCFNQLDLPEYASYESLRQHLYMAMTAGSEYFGFA